MLQLALTGRAHGASLQSRRWVYGDDKTASKALRDMLPDAPTAPGSGILHAPQAKFPAVKRTGSGGKGDPYMYSLL